MFAAWAFVLIPLVLFLLAFVVETIMSFRRLSNHVADGSYLNATWEVSHTFLVVSVACFVAFFSNDLNELAHAAFNGLFLASIFVGLRAVAYLHIFYVRDQAARKTRNWIDWGFALTHIGIVAGVLVLLIQLLPVLLSTELTPNTQFLPWMWPGLVLVLALCVLPIYSLYHPTKRR